jgi:hypothetical protein
MKNWVQNNPKQKFIHPLKEKESKNSVLKVSHISIMLMQSTKIMSSYNWFVREFLKIYINLTKHIHISIKHKMRRTIEFIKRWEERTTRCVLLMEKTNILCILLLISTEFIHFLRISYAFNQMRVEIYYFILLLCRGY